MEATGADAGKSGPSAKRAPIFRVRDLVTGSSSPYTSVERLVALAVADHMNGAGVAWPSIPRLCAWAGLRPTAIRKALVRLCAGPLAIFDRTAGGARQGARYQSSTYTLAEPSASRAPRVASPSSGGAEPSASRSRALRVAADIDEQTNEQTQEQTKTSPPATAGRAAVLPVFNHWRQTMGHPTAKLIKKRVDAIQARFREGYSVEDLLRAIDGCHASPFHMGENQSRTVYDDLMLICRDGAKVEQFRALASNSATAPAGPRTSWEAQGITEAEWNRRHDQLLRDGGA